MASLAEPSVDRWVLEEAPRICVADVTLGLTVYLAEPLIWAQKGAATLLGVFGGVARGAGVRWWRTSTGRKRPQPASRACKG